MARRKSRDRTGMAVVMAVIAVTVLGAAAGHIGTAKATSSWLPRAPLPNTSVAHQVRGPQDRDTDAQRMLQIIRDSLARGDRDLATGQFAMLEGRYPDSPATTEARELLLRREGPTRNAAVPPPVPLPPPAASRPGPETPAPIRPAPEAVERAPAVAPSRPWTTEIRRVRALTQDFQASTGDRIFFSPASAELGSRAKAVISAQAAWLKRNPQVPVLLSAHADDVGGRDFNAELSRRRGDAVRALLVADGIEPGRIRVVAHGRERRIADCETATCAAQNRRVVTVIGDTEPALTGQTMLPTPR